MSPSLLVGALVLVTSVRASEGADSPVEAVPVEAAPPEAVPVEAALPEVRAPIDPGPTPLQVWEHERLRILDVADTYTVGSTGRTYTAVEVAALTRDAALLESFADRERASRRESRVLLLTGALLATLGIAELSAVALADEGSSTAEDHLWRGTIELAAAGVPLTVFGLPVRREAARRREVAIAYPRADVEARIEAYNRELRDRLGVDAAPGAAAPAAPLPSGAPSAEPPSAPSP